MMTGRSRPGSCGWVAGTVVLMLGVCGLMIGQGRAQSNDLRDGRAFIEWALPKVPTAKPLQFVDDYLFEAIARKDLTTVVQAPDELRLASTGWRIVSPNPEPLLRAAIDRMSTYLFDAMNVSTQYDPAILTADTSHSISVIVDRSAACAAPLGGPKDYRSTISDKGIQICARTARGAAHGIYDLEARLERRGGPFLPRSLDVTRKSRFATRMATSALGWGHFPDAYLRYLARAGFDAIFALEYANPTAAPRPWGYGLLRDHDPKMLDDVVARAANVGIDVYGQLLFELGDTGAKESELRKLVRDTIARFPKIRGYILLDEGFLVGRELPGWDWSVGRSQAYLKKWARGIAIVRDEVVKIDPSIEVIPWDYALDARPSALALKRDVIASYPSSVAPMVTWERGKSVERYGEIGYLEDYAINEVGPSETTAAQIDLAKRRGMKVYAKADTSSSWQFGTFPYVPAPQQWLDRYDKLDAVGVDATLEAWSYGIHPSFVATLRTATAWTNAPTRDALLAAEAKRLFGEEAVPRVISAWAHFSAALKQLPDLRSSSFGTNSALAVPLFLVPPEPTSVTHYTSWYNGLTLGSILSVDPRWPHQIARLVPMPDFSGKTNVSADYASPFSLDVFLKSARDASKTLEMGLVDYRIAASRAPEALRRQAISEVLLAEQIKHMVDSMATVLEFEDVRVSLVKRSATDRSAALDRMERLARAEHARVILARAIAMRDSRLGFQRESDYVYSTERFDAKLSQLDVLLNVQFPAVRRDELGAAAPFVVGPHPTTPFRLSKFHFLVAPHHRIECRLVPENWGGCPSMLSFEIGDGTHVAQVRSISPLGAISSVAEHRWTVDSTPPIIAVPKGPKAPKSTERFAEFGVQASKETVELYCRMNGDGDFARCPAPLRYVDLPLGLNKFDVFARDRFGRQSPTLSYIWIIEP